MQTLLKQIKQCRLCENILPFEPKPILQASNQSEILILGQAPGAKTHLKGIPFDDKSGDRLRAWLGVNKAQFYDADLFTILPMGFCYPGRGISGDLPPTKQCTKTWHDSLLTKLTKIELTILLGKYAIEWHLQSRAPVTKLVKQWQALLKSNQIVLPHPSPRNNIWLKKNDWFEKEVIPTLQQKTKEIISKDQHP